MTTVEELHARVGRLHDALLSSVDMQWAEGTVTVGIRTVDGPGRIVVEGVSRLVCPREHPWGRSDSIHEVRFGRPPSGAPVQVEIEMQSGGMLVICGSEVGVE